MITNEQIKNLCSRLRLYALPRLLESEAHLAQEQGKNHVEFLHDLLSREVQERDSKDFQRRLKAAALPARHDLDLFDHNYSQGITAPRLRELRRMGWLEQNYNLILMGPSGTGKTFIAAELVYEAVGQGYKAYMVTMEDVINTIKMKTLMPSAMSAYNRLLKADLVAIDDIMLFPVQFLRNLFLQHLCRLRQEMNLIPAELLYRHSRIAHGLFLQNIRGSLIHKSCQRPVRIGTGDPRPLRRLVAAHRALRQQQQINLCLLPGQTKAGQPLHIVRKSALFQQKHPRLSKKGKAGFLCVEGR